MSGWSAEQDRDLLLTMIAEHPPTKGDWITISAKFGHGKTAEACRQHFAKLLKSKAATAATSTDATDSANTTEPTKPTRGVTKKAPNAKKRKAADDNADGSADEEAAVGIEYLAGKGVAKARAAAKAATSENGSVKAKAEPKPKAPRAKKVKSEAGAGDAGFKTVNYSGDEAAGGEVKEEEGGKNGPPPKNPPPCTSSPISKNKSITENGNSVGRQIV